MGQLRYKDPTTLAWIDIPTTGPRGVQGQDGPEGPPGPMTDEVWVGPDAPTDPDTVLWFDTDDNRLIGPAEIPPGGLAKDMLTKVTDLDGDVGWRNPHIMQNGEVIRFPNQADPTPKIYLYSDAFGLGVESGSTTIFASSFVRLRQSSMTGTEFANFGAAGMGPSVSYNVSFLNGFSGTCDFRVTPAMVVCRLTNMTRNANTELGAQTKVCAYPAGVPAPPNMSSGYRSLAKERNANWSSDNAARWVTLHFDATGLWIIPTGDVFYSGKYFDALVTWAR